jgi:hypothetical protein
MPNLIICTTQSSIAGEGISEEVRRQRGEWSSNPRKAPLGQDTISVERCAIKEGKGAQTAPSEKERYAIEERRRGARTAPLEKERCAAGYRR